MPMIIYSGDTQKCISIDKIECPACSKSFDQLKGQYLFSSTLGSEVKVCLEHTELSALEEIHIQTVLTKTLKDKNGFVQKDRKLVKRTELMELADFKGV